MKITNIFLVAAMAAFTLSSCGSKSAKAAEKLADETSKVYMTTDISPEGLVKVYEALGRPATGRVAVKISTGEPGRKKGQAQMSEEEMAKALEAVGKKASDRKPEVKHAPDHKRNFLKPELIKNLVQKVNGTIV